MKTLIIYDSAYGNTEKIAQTIAKAIDEPNLVVISPVSETSQSFIRAADMVIVGSPTQGGQPTKTMQQYLNNLSENLLKNKRVAVFDTRFAAKDHGFGLRLLMKTIGFAAPRLAHILQAKGGTLITDPVGFIVEDKKGPLKNGELERASVWGKQVVRSLS